jgi:hypothetical protein
MTTAITANVFMCPSTVEKVSVALEVRLACATTPLFQPIADALRANTRDMPSLGVWGGERPRESLFARPLHRLPMQSLSRLSARTSHATPRSIFPK